MLLYVGSYGVTVGGRRLQDVFVSSLIDERPFLVELGRVDILVHSQTVWPFIVLWAARALQRALTPLLHRILTAHSVASLMTRSHYGGVRL